MDWMSNTLCRKMFVEPEEFLLQVSEVGFGYFYAVAKNHWKIAYSMQDSRTMALCFMPLLFGFQLCMDHTNFTIHAVRDAPVFD